MGHPRNVMSVRDLFWNSTHGQDDARSQYFTYDCLNRIQTAAEGPGSGVGRWGQSYTIDPWGNLNQITNTKGTSTSMSAAIDPDNNLHSNTRDSAGNTTADGNHTYTWDGESRLAGIDSSASTYTYDASGMRVRKTTGSNYTEYIYFGGQVIAERDQTGAWTDYIYAGGKRIAKAPGVIATTGTEFYHGDHLGSARLMTDASGGVVTGSEGTFLPYGEEFAPTTSGNHYKFTGKERDAETTNDYFGARYYGWKMGRFLTPDWSDAPTPVPYADFNDPQTLNLYGYVGNRPITNADKDGHCDWCFNAAARVLAWVKSHPPVGEAIGNVGKSTELTVRAGVGAAGNYKAAKGEASATGYFSSGPTGIGFGVDATGAGKMGSLGGEGTLNLPIMKDGELVNPLTNASLNPAGTVSGGGDFVGHASGGPDGSSFGGTYGEGIVVGGEVSNSGFGEVFKEVGTAIVSDVKNKLAEIKQAIDTLGSKGTNNQPSPDKPR